MHIQNTIKTLHFAAYVKDNNKNLMVAICQLHSIYTFTKRGEI